MRQLGCDPVPLIRRYGIDPSALDQSDAIIPLRATLLLLEESAAVAGCPDLGLRLASSYKTDMLGVIALVIQNAPTIGQAITDASRYLGLHSPSFRLILEDKSSLFEDCATVRFEIRMDEFLPQRQTLDACLGHAVQSARLFNSDMFSLRAVSLPHAPVASEHTYRKFFGAPIFFEQPYAGLHVQRELLSLEQKSVNPVIRQLAVEHIANLIPVHGTLLSERVREILTKTLGAGRGTKGEIAGFLGMHPRTLQRHLDQEGMTFDTIREDVYRSAALRYLYETSVPLKQLAGALGFSEQSAFTRACKRWFGASPKELRSRTRCP